MKISLDHSWVDKGTASASEIVSGVVHDLDRGVIIR
ncbi:MAG: hypothetical protein IPP42_01040 [Saprospiraceae bacterium]|nr:hypothetical protein [Saprospiraceae bacterium]